ncbi:MAG: hypothetical protein KKA42_12335, partial [candidate division Zixibacteria bacterium]|nr:hypothetical protein [candidate division Zixibacteria bacterium]
MRKSVTTLLRTICGRLIPAALVVLLAVTASVGAADLTSRTLSDVQVLYIYQQPESIDWPTLYYLNDAHNARVDLLTLGNGDGYRLETDEIPDREIFLNRLLFDSRDSTLLDSALIRLFEQRLPDVVILGETGSQNGYPLLEQRLTELAARPSPIWAIRRMFRLADDVPAAGATNINRFELFQRYRTRMLAEIPTLFSWWQNEYAGQRKIVRYNLTYDGNPAVTTVPDFLTGMDQLRLIPLFESQLDDGAVRNSLVNRARNFISFFSLAQGAQGVQKIDYLITGYKQLMTLADQAASDSRLTSLDGFRSYLNRLTDRAQKAVLTEMGMDWNGKIVLRDSPHGPRLKFRAALSVNGPKEIELSYVRFHPYWGDPVMVLDSVSHIVQPHQSFVQEYLVDIDRDRLEAQMPESLLFTANIVYGTVPLTLQSALPIWERPDLKVEFQPDFHFVAPQARVNVDKVVSSMNWKVIITKAMHYHGTARLDLVTPRGVFAGAYRQTIPLEKGRRTETVRIPFSISNLFELGIHEQSVTLSIEGRVAAADTGIIRVAACDIPDTISIGFLPDTTGMLEDILRMTRAKFRPITDRALQTGDLDAYDVIVVGTGALRANPSFSKVKGRLEDYLRYGGSLVILGQPSDWP